MNKHEKSLASNDNRMTASEIAADIKSGKTSCRETVAFFLERIKRLNPDIHALVQVFEKAALQRAKAADEALQQGKDWGPLHGVPVTIKEAFDYRGSYTTANFRPRFLSQTHNNATIVNKLENAGAIILGKTNNPALLIDHQTRGFIYKRANNPHRLDYTPGGSSGGGAAAVAAGFTPLDFGSDSGGSLRIPAHFCGVFSLKPTAGQVPLEGLRPPFGKQPESFRRLVGVGPMARSVNGLELGYQAIREARPSSKLPLPNLQSYSVAWTNGFGPHQADGKSYEALNKLVYKISGKGILAKEDSPETDWTQAFQAWAVLFGQMIGQAIPAFLKWPVRACFRYLPFSGPFFGPYIAQGITDKGKLLSSAYSIQKEVVSGLETFFENYDFLICPVAATNAFTHRMTGTPIWDSDGRSVPYWQNTLPYVCPFNLSGHPVLVIPVAEDTDGLPIGLQVATRRGGERSLLHFGRYLETDL
ncbi:MAG: amidase [Phaeodactylibacter sp.]|nr:amidase [Phaeodactylibacter sp.]MCB9293791.1 amidase [Lewinellaceae bacterium]